MKASEMIYLLAKQIEMNGDKKVKFVGNKVEGMFIEDDVEYEILSVTALQTDNEYYIEIYGE